MSEQAPYEPGTYGHLTGTALNGGQPEPGTFSRLLSAAEILAASDLTYEDVPVPEWGGTVRIRSLTGFERDRFESDSVSVKGKNSTVNLINLRARLVALCAVDASGNRMFVSDEQVRQLGKKSAAALDRLFSAAQRLSGLGDDDVEELAGNSEPGLNGSSTSV